MRIGLGTLQRPAVWISLLVLAVLLRLVSFLQPHLLTFDDAVYSTLGYQLRHYPTNYSTTAIFKIVEQSGPNEMEYLHRGLFKHPPLYPLTIALSYLLFGSNIFSALLPSLAAWAGTCLLVRKIAGHVFGPAAGMLAFLICLVDPMGWILSLKIYSECMLTCLLLLAVWLYLNRNNGGSLFSVGVVLGLACLTKYSAVLFLFGIVLHASILRRYRGIGALAAAFSLVTAPWFGAQIAVYGSNFWRLTQADFFVPPLFLVEMGLIAVLAYVLLHPLLAHLSKLRYWDSPRGLWIARLVPCICMLFPLLWFGGMTGKALSWSGMPVTSFLSNFPCPPGFYFYQPLLYLPFLVLAPLSPLLLLNRENKSHLYLLLILIVSFFAAANLWHLVRIRYLYPVLPLAMVLAGAALRKIWELADTMPGWPGKAARIGVAAAAGFLTLKTLRVDWFAGFVHLSGIF